MSGTTYYRGGTSLRPRRRDIQLDPQTGLVLPTRGISVFSRPDNLDRFGGAHAITNVPAELQIIQRGRDPTHFEIVPVRPMPQQEYEDALDKIVLVPVNT
jgi:hypothetical protein